MKYSHEAVAAPALGAQVPTPDDKQDDKFAELKFRRAESMKMGGHAAIERQHHAGRFTVRERIEKLVDASSFREVGTLAGTGSYDESKRLVSVTPAPYVAGVAKIDGRAVAIGGEDFTVRGGTTFGSARRKGGQGGFIGDLAHHYRIPLVNLIDGAGGSVTSLKRRGHSVFPGVHGFEQSVQLLGEVPVASAVLGTAAGGPAGAEHQPDFRCRASSRETFFRPNHR
jgi:acetyl-CoA carboxylase carboxyltransferase component